MDNLDNLKSFSINAAFGNRYLDSRGVYFNHFDCIPSVAVVWTINGEKAFDEFIKNYKDKVVKQYQYREYNKKTKKYLFDQTVVVLNNQILLELDESYCKILHDGLQADVVHELMTFIGQFKVKSPRPPLEINVIVEGEELELKPMEIKRTKLDVGLYYEDDFAQVDAVIRTRLNKMNDKGIVLLHGLPGTGKTTYIRYLIGKTKKKVLFVSPVVAGRIMNPDFINLLIDNPNSIIIIEDAENIIMDRKLTGGSSVSNLLNISDGLIADFLNVQIICTFNSSLTTIDSALMRKGRLIAKYEFGKLSVPKAQKLSDHLGYNKEIKRPMTLAEISNQGEKDFESPQVSVIGFRRNAVFESQ